MTGYPAAIELASLALLLVGIGLAFSDIRLSGWVLGWILLSGVRGAFVFPVKAEGKTIGVFAFNSHEIREPDAQLLVAVGVIGGQVGGFLHRKRGEDA